MRIIKFKFIITFLLYCSLSGQYRFEHLYVPEGGIPLDLVYTMMQDSKGFIWLGTMYGLVRFDGREYKTFRHDPENTNSLSHDDIISLHEDSKGFLWIGTWGGGLNKYDPEKNNFQRFPDTAGVKIIWDIEEDRKGNIWLASQNNTLIKYDPHKKNFTTYPSVKINKIYLTSSEEILLCTNRGIFKFDYSGQKIVNDHRFKEVKDQVIHSMLKDSLNQFWIGTDNGIYTFSNGSAVKHIENGLSSKVIRKLEIDGSGNIWAGTTQGIIKIEKDKNAQFLPYNSGYNFIHEMFFDHSGILWISVYNTGVSKLKPGSDKFSAVSLPGIVSFTEDDDSNIWIANHKGELILFNSLEKSTRIILNTRKSINSIYYNKGSIWIAAVQGLFRFDPPAKVLSFITDGTFSTMLDNGNTILLGTQGMGLYFFDKAAGKKGKINLNPEGPVNQFTNSILSIYKDSNQRIWVGTYGGLFLLNKNYELINQFEYDQRANTSISNNYIFSVYEDSDKVIWIGTSNGLNKFVEAEGFFQRYYEKNGLPNGVINGITDDNSGNLWIITNKGVSKLNLKENRFINYNDRDGLLSNVFRMNGILKSKTVFIYISSFNGINYFEPSKLQLSKYQPDIRISSISSVDSELLPVNNYIRLDPEQTTIKIKFASMDFDDPYKHQYQYILENYDDKWVDAKNVNMAVFTRIPPGDYVFRVKATNSDGIWSNNEAVLNITVIPPFYLSWWFMFLSALAAVLIIFILFSLRIKQKMKFAAALEKVRIEESEKIRMKTAMDFHDELGHHLTRITLLAGLIKSKFSNSHESGNLPDKIIENANSLYTGTKDFIWAIDPHNDSLYEVLIRLKDFGDDLYSKTDICFELMGLNENLKKVNLSMDLRRNVLLIFKEAMNNSLKYASSDRIVLESGVTDKEFLISLQDFGKGFTEYKKDIHGLSNMMKRAQKISGNLEITSLPDQGTRIAFRSVIGTEDPKFGKLKGYEY